MKYVIKSSDGMYMVDDRINGCIFQSNIYRAKLFNSKKSAICSMHGFYDPDKIKTFKVASVKLIELK